MLLQTNHPLAWQQQHCTEQAVVPSAQPVLLLLLLLLLLLQARCYLGKARPRTLMKCKHGLVCCDTSKVLQIRID
jgi:hypothetical protein